MKNTQTLTCSEKKYTYNILNSINAEIELTENPFDLKVEELFDMAARINKKRSFLFVSKVLGKHIPAHPQKALLTSALLAVGYLEKVKGKKAESKDALLAAFKMNDFSYILEPFIDSTHRPLIIGFAETATALGHAFIDCFETADFFHTTREELLNIDPVIRFEEEHSHATSHRCYIPLELLQDGREIILVDDELTTGNTALNIIRSIQSQFPRKEYTVVSILDWRSEEARAAFKQAEDEIGITIHIVSLVSGLAKINNEKEIEEEALVAVPEERILAEVEYIHLPNYFSGIHNPSVSGDGKVNNSYYLKETGRFSLKAEENGDLWSEARNAAEFLLPKRNGSRTLCLGTGEFMYLPMKIASFMGEGVSYQSTTRSPIYVKNEPGYGAKYGLAFPNPEDKTVNHFVYNIPPGLYDEVFVFFEREVLREQLAAFLKELKKTLIPSVKIVFFSAQRGERHE